MSKVQTKQVLAAVSLRAGEAARRVALPQRRRLVELLRSLGGCQLFTAHSLSRGLPLAPTLDDQILLGEAALHHLACVEAVSSLHDGTGEGELLRILQKRLADLPSAYTWAELVVARFVLSAAASVLLELGRRWAAGDAWREALDGMAALEVEHRDVSQAMLRDLLQGGARRSDVQVDLERWLRIVVLFLEAATGSAGARARSGLAHDDAAKVLRDLTTGLEPTLSECGLRLRLETGEAHLGALRP